MDIEGLSATTLEKFIGHGWIRNFGDLYDLEQHREEIVSTEGFGEKSFERLQASIEKSRNCTLAKFIAGLGIPMVGRHPPMRRKGQSTDFSALSEFYVLSAMQGYFVKRSSRHIWFARNQKPTNPGIRKFKTEKAAQKYLDDNQEIFSKYAFQIECVQNGGVPA